MRASNPHVVGACSLSLLLGAGIVWAQDRELRDLEGFDSIAVGGGVDVYVAIGQEFRVEVESDSPEQIITRVRGDTLEVGHEPREVLGFNISWGKIGAVHVTLPVLGELSASGGSDVVSVGTITGDSLEISTSGGSDVDLEIDVANLTVRTSGGSDVDLAGSARFASIASSGGSDFRALELTVSEAELRSSGGADLSVTVSDRLVARASGGSDITYSGQPANVDIDSSGGADIRGRR